MNKTIAYFGLLKLLPTQHKHVRFNTQSLEHGYGVMNDNSERLVDFCLDNNYIIGDTIFAHRESISSPGNHLMVEQATTFITLS